MTKRNIGLRGLALVLATSCGLSATVLAPMTASAATASAVQASPRTLTLAGVQAGADGWLQYTPTLAATGTSGQLKGAVTSTAKTTLLQGKKGADGNCTFSYVGTPTSSAAATYQEEVAYNPTTCQQKVQTGTLTAAQVAKLNGVGAATTKSATAAAAAKNSSVNQFAAAAVSYQSAYAKTAWIDPVNLTITSLTANIKWPLYGAGGTLSARFNPYMFKYDGWSTSGLNPIKFVTLAGDTGWSTNANEKFTNQDFAALVYLVGGVAGWASCGLHLTITAHFYHSDTVYGLRNGTRNRAWSDSKDGACSDLVHHGDWSGYGWAS